MKTVYLLVGKAGSGKDTIADLATEVLAYNDIVPARLSFATLLKSQAEILGWNGVKDIKGRTFLQELGDVMQAYHGKEYYAEYVLERILENNDTDVFFVPDCRFQTELALFRNCSDIRTIMVRVIRPDYESTLTAEQKSHHSETELDDIAADYLLINEADKERLKHKVKHMLQTTLHVPIN